MVFLAVGLSLFVYCQKDDQKSTTLQDSKFHYAATNNKEFYGNIESIEKDKNFNKRVYGGIVSHHLLAAPEIAKFFKNISHQKVSTVVVIGPNHYERASDILISQYSYKTPWGVLETDHKNIKKILNSNLAKNREKPFKNEHSISALAGFVKYSFPEAKFIPIILGKKAPASKLNLLSEKLKKILPEDSLVLASVDFSHHLHKTAAIFHDRKSIATIAGFDLRNIRNLEIDSPASIYTLLKYSKQKNTQEIDYKNVNSAELVKNDGLEDVTSYLFAYFKKGQKSQEKNISILSFGDAIFDREIKNLLENKESPFEKIRGAEGNFLRGTDFNILNLEGPITNKKNCQDKQVNFKFNSSVASLLSENNINLVNLANNHIFDCLEEGAKDTRENLKEAGIDYFGGKKPKESYKIKKVNGQKIAFVGIDQTLKLIEIDFFYNLISKLKKENDYVFVNIHWGYEYDKLPSKAQKKTAHGLIESGADVIIGHHPHVIQPIEKYKDGVIFYSLGNFIFDQKTRETNKGIAVGSILEQTKFDFYIFPYKIINGKPKLMPYNERAGFCKSFLNKIDNKETCVFSLP